MALPDLEVVRGWVGKTVVDRDGAEIGVCTEVFADDATGLPEWMRAELAGSPVLVPLVDAVELAHRVRVAVSRIDVASAPSLGDTRHLSEAEVAALYRHYGVEYSRAASESLLPAREAEPPASDSPPGAPAAGTAESAAPPATSSEALFPWQPATDEAVAQPDTRLPAQRGPRLAVISGVLTGLGAILAAVSRVRRLAVRPPATPAQRAAQRARAASVAARARAGQIAASAAPLVATRHRVRGGTPAGAGSARRAASATPRLAAAAAARAAARATAVGPSGLRGKRLVGGAVGSVPEVASARGARLHNGGRRMMGTLTAGLSFGAGYVLGSRAGRERFQQLKQTAATVAQRPQLQQARERLKTAATAKLHTGTGGLMQRTAGVTAKLRRRSPSTGPVTGAQTPPSALSDAGMAGGSPLEPGVAQEPLGTPRQPNGTPGGQS